MRVCLFSQSSLDGVRNPHILKRMGMTGLDLGAAIPDFDARYHDFRADPDDPQRIWCQMRVTGTQTGELRFGGLGGVSAKPQQPPVKFSNPPEAVSLKFDDEGRVRQITTGYPLDRRCGTTGGLGGLFGVFEGLGYPLPTPLTRTSAQVLSPILSLLGSSPAKEAVPAMTEIDAADALPEARLLQLTSDLIASGFGTAGRCLLLVCVLLSVACYMCFHPFGRL